MSKTNSRVTSIDDDEAQDAAVAQKSAAPIVVGKNTDTALSGKRVDITIFPTEGAGGNDAVFVSLNGYAYQIPRGEPQSVPVEVAEIIRNAKTTLSISGEKGGITERTIQRYSFQIG